MTAPLVVPELDDLLDALEDARSLIGSSDLESLNDRYDADYRVARQSVIRWVAERTLTAEESEEALDLTGLECEEAQSPISESLYAKLRASVGRPLDRGCKLPPAGWSCSREEGHDGPCAARRISGNS